MSTKTTSSIQYQNLPSARRPVAHSDEVSVSTYTTMEVSEDGEFCQSNVSTDTDDKDLVASEVDA